MIKHPRTDEHHTPGTLEYKVLFAGPNGEGNGENTTCQALRALVDEGIGSVAKNRQTRMGSHLSHERIRRVVSVIPLQLECLYNLGVASNRVFAIGERRGVRADLGADPRRRIHVDSEHGKTMSAANPPDFVRPS